METLELVLFFIFIIFACALLQAICPLNEGFSFKKTFNNATRLVKTVAKDVKGKKNVVKGTKNVVKGARNVGRGIATRTIGTIGTIGMLGNTSRSRDCPEKFTLPLREYCIFASANTALASDMKRVELDQIKTVMNTGCRFIELEIFSVDNKPVVGYSKDKTSFNIDTENQLSLGDVLYQIATDGFSTSPNVKDPIFIHLIITSNSITLYDKIANVIESKLEPVLYKGRGGNEVMMNTPLCNLMGKVIITIDGEGEKSRNYNKLGKYIKMESSKYHFRKYNANELTCGFRTPPIIKDDNKTTDINFMKIVYPKTIYNNPDMGELATQFGAQIIMNQFYSPDDNLSKTQGIFRDSNTAFVSLARMKRYLQNQ